MAFEWPETSTIRMTEGSIILVTGATGHIGNVLVRKLLEKGEKVRALIWRGEDTTAIEGLDVDFVEGDVLDPESLRAAFRGIWRVFHLAGLISIMPGAVDVLRRINVQGTRNVLRAAKDAAVDRFVYVSSIHAFQPVANGRQIDEDVPFDPTETAGEYGRTKAEASLEVRAAAEGGLNATIVCPTGVIGPYDFRRSEMGSVILDAALGKTMPYVDGSYDFVDVRDVADGMIRAEQMGRPRESYILSGQRISVRYVLETVRRATGKAFRRVRIPFGIAKAAAAFSPYYYRLKKSRPRFTPLSLEVLRSNSDVSHAKATRELGYNPRGLYESIADTARWFIENRRLFAGTR
jgi:nucleoside-diphosphate-sugar epimerase